MPKRREIPLDVELRQMLLSPLGQKDIAFLMKITHGTLKIYCAGFYRKLGVSGRIELMGRELQRLSS